jgi:hypothetical protein
VDERELGSAAANTMSGIRPAQRDDGIVMSDDTNCSHPEKDIFSLIFALP